ncbi:MAG: hypothetical protein IT258_00925 [Saprospiraceae bacterium]|nr:hypothetical protein [Saprospiraceae bacterium]
MKISKSLLQAIVVGVTLGTATSSCDLVETLSTDDVKQERKNSNGEIVNPRDNNGENGTCNPNDEGGNCPGCGMG